VVFTVINIIGLKEVSWVSTILSVAVLIGFSAAAIIGFANWHYNPVMPFMPPDTGIVEALGGSICICVWMFCGYESISNIAGEVNNPQVIPKGLLIAMPIIALSYLLPTIGGLASVGQWDAWAVEGEGAVGYIDIFITNLGPGFGLAFLAIAIMSNCSIFNAYIASGSRGFFVMADDHLCPRFLVSVILLGFVTIVLCQFDFTTLIMATTPLLLYLYMALSIAVHRLRTIIPLAERGNVYAIKGGKFGLYFMTVLPFVISIIALGVNGTEYFMMGFAALASGLIAYLGFKWYYGGLYKNDPTQHPINARTKLAVGDMFRIAWFIMMSGLASLLGSAFLYWYEGDWGAEFYLETYGSGLFSNFGEMITLLQVGGGGAIIIGAIIYAVGRRIDSNTDILTSD
jgi:amino acid transporter